MVVAYTALTTISPYKLVSKAGSIQ